MEKLPLHSEAMYNNFISFSAERHRVFTRRQLGLPQEDWTSDSILKRYSFCNSFRVLDRGSQFYITDVMADETSDLSEALLRTAMYRMTNEPKFWKFYVAEAGGMPTLEDMEGPGLDRTKEIFQKAYDTKTQIFRSSYRVFFTNNKNGIGRTKHELATDYFQTYFHPEGEKSVWPKFSAAETMESRMLALEDALRIGPFMAQQIVTDLNYTQHHLGTENDRVLLGPGSTMGLQYIFGATEVPSDPHNMRGEFMIRKLREKLHEKDVVITLPSGDTRPLSLMDVQNCLCEFSKYVRYAKKMQEEALGTLTSKKVFDARKRPLEIQLPAHWEDETLLG